MFRMRECSQHADDSEGNKNRRVTNKECRLLRASGQGGGFAQSPSLPSCLWNRRSNPEKRTCTRLARRSGIALEASRRLEYFLPAISSFARRWPQGALKDVVTIGLPFCNDRNTLARAVRSVFAQTLRDWQLILVDDGSTDGSLELAQSVRDERVRVVSDRQNRGLAYRLNQIASLAEGRYLARMDADDLMHPERLARQLEWLEQEPELDLVDTGLLILDALDCPTGQRCCKPLRVSRNRILAGHVPVHASVLARTDWFRANRYDDRYRRAQDLELWCRVLTRDSLRIQRLPVPLYFVREATGTTYAKIRSTYRVHREIVRRHGPQLIGVAATRIALARVGLKQFAYCSASLWGVQDALVSRRNQPLSDLERRVWTSVIDQVLQTSVPGMMDHEGQMAHPSRQFVAA